MAATVLNSPVAIRASVQFYRGEEREISPDLPDTLPSTENQISNPQSQIR